MKRTSLLALGLGMSAIALAGCASGASDATAVTSAAVESPSPTRTTPPDTDGDGVLDAQDDFPSDPTRTVQLRYPSGAAVVDGYPLIVDTSQLDYRLANWIKTDQAVALAPGVYAAYNPAAPDLSLYLDGSAEGDCAVRELYGFEGGACWDGVLASPEEPAS